MRTRDAVGGTWAKRDGPETHFLALKGLMSPTIEDLKEPKISKTAPEAPFEKLLAKIEKSSLKYAIKVDFWSFLRPPKIVKNTPSHSSRKQVKSCF